ncbi:unnamed protein product [Prunus brigantina]
MMKVIMIISTLLISLITFQGMYSGHILVEARDLADQSSSKHPMSSLPGTDNIGSKLFVTKKGLTGNYTQRSKSPPPPPKAAPTPKQTPTITDILEKSPPSTRYISSA